MANEFDSDRKKGTDADSKAQSGGQGGQGGGGQKGSGDFPHCSSAERDGPHPSSLYPAETAPAPSRRGAARTPARTLCGLAQLVASPAHPGVIERTGVDSICSIAIATA